MKAPCKECNQRSPTCHSSCPVYQAFVNDCQERRKEKAKEIAISSVYYDGRRRMNNINGKLKKFQKGGTT